MTEHWDNWQQPEQKEPHQKDARREERSLPRPDDEPRRERRDDSSSPDDSSGA